MFVLAPLVMTDAKMNETGAEAVNIIRNDDGFWNVNEMMYENGRGNVLMTGNGTDEETYES